MRRTLNHRKRWWLLPLLFTFAAGCNDAPAIVFADGSKQFSDDWRDSWLVINYWAEWCAPCRTEIPELNELHKNGPASVRVLGVNFDGLRGQELLDAIARMQIEFPVVVDDLKGLWGYAQPSVLPMTVLVRPDGKLHAQLEGPQTEESLMAAMR